MGDLSPHFSRKEFACHCCGRMPLNWVEDETPPLVLALEQLRTTAGAPVHILSGYRCPAHNAAVGGEQHSQHLLGHAADIQVAGKDIREIYELACGVQTFENGGIGLYPQQRFVHVDVRGHLARWAKLDGEYVNIEEALG